MNKRYAHHLLKRLQRLSIIFMLIAFLAASATFVLAYRHNNIRALELRDNVLAIDKTNGDIEAALKELRLYTYSHMNANLSGGQGSAYPPIQLKYRYDRLVAAERSRVDAANGATISAAQKHCESPGVSAPYGTRVKCTEAYISSHPQVQTQPIQDALYKFDFAAPVWSPDLAGWSLVAAIFILIVLITRIGLGFYLKHSLRD